MKNLINGSMDLGKVLGLAGGAIVGAAIGWVVGEVLAYQIYEKEIEYYDEVIDEEGYSVDDSEPIIMKKTVSTRNDDKKVVTNYAEAFKKGKLAPEEDDEEELLEEVIVNGESEEEEMDDGRPFVVTEEEWTNAEDGWESVNLTYYEDDRVVTNDSDDAIVRFPETLIGPHALSSFGDGTTDPDTVFIKNVDEQKYFEISRVHGSYDEIVLGLPKPEPKKIKMKKVADRDDIDEEARAAKKRRAKVKAKLNDETTED